MPEQGMIDALMSLAREESSPKRRELLRAVTDLFMANPEISDKQSELFDSVMIGCADKAGVEGRRDLAERLGPVEHAPHGIVSHLAHDEEISVAGPVLSQSPVLNDADLVSVAETRGDDHMAAIADRRSINSIVTDVLIRARQQHRPAPRFR